MKTSKVAIFHSAGRPFTYETIPVPALREGEILIRNEYTTLCRSDLTTFIGKRLERTPTILGHEIVGVIEELGPGAPQADARGAELRVGDRVTWAIFAADPDGPMARRGLRQKSPDLFKYGHEQVTPQSTLHGGLAEYCVLRKHTPLIRLGQAIPLPILALINCSVATVAGSLRLAGSLHERSVLVTGAGMLGVIACAMCQCLGAKRIVAVDIDPQRLQTAGKFGADVAVPANSGGSSLKERLAAVLPGEPATIALDYSGAPEMMEALPGLLGVGGTAVFVGATFPQRAIQLHAEQLVRGVLTLRGLHNYNEQDLVAAVEFIEKYAQRFPFASLVDDRFDLDSVNEAFDHGIRSGAHRVGVRTRAKP
ncbi:MAG: zinc-binding dehydrogenase [Verrucomicrobiota bacterium]